MQKPESDENKLFTVLFAGGGNGGHLMPGLSVAQELRRRFPECRLAFAGTCRPMERRLVEGHGFEFFALPSVRYEGTAFAAPGWMLRMISGLVAAWRLLRRVKPNMVVSLGCYAAVPSCMAAILRNVPMVIMEQNAVPGKANRLLSWGAREIYVPWPGVGNCFARSNRVHVTGNPVRQDLLVQNNLKPASRFGLSSQKRTLLVMGGSQGARFINEAMVNALKRLEPEASWLQILHSTGETHYESVRRAYRDSSIQAAVLPYIEDMASAYGLCDLALCRAGGTTLAELTALGVPAMLVPLPSAANDHQRRNASLVAGEGAAILADEADLTGGRLAGILLDLLRNEACLARMHRAGLRLGRPAAADNVVDRMMSVMWESMASEVIALSAPVVRRG